jgi:predicted enzyme related to lactoylglutathione lyase
MAAEIVHIEFKSANFNRTTEFYARLFDWRTEQNASASYMKLSGDGAPSGGWVRADLVQAPGPIAYLAVDDLGAKLVEVERAGGRVLVHSLPFAGGGEIGLFADPDGNIMGLWRRKEAAATAQSATVTPTGNAAGSAAGTAASSAATAGRSTAPARAAEPAKPVATTPAKSTPRPATAAKASAAAKRPTKKK